MTVLRKCFLGVVIAVILLIMLSSRLLYNTLPKTNIRNKVEMTAKVRDGNSTFYIPTIYRGDCKVTSADSLKEYSEKKNASGIPSILHYVSNEEDISKAYSGVYKNCMTLNSDMRVVLWTDASFYSLLVGEFDKHIARKWEHILSDLDNPMRTSMIRAMVLFIFGGVSLSLDTVCQQPLRNARNNASCFVSVGHSMKANIELGRDNEYGESVFGCVPDHPFLFQLIVNSKNIEMGRNYFTDNFLAYNKINTNAKVTQLNIKTAEQVLPKSEMDKICAKNSTSTKQKSGCNSLKSYKPLGSSTAMMVHQPIYGISHQQIVADDVCFLGVGIHIVIM